MWAVCPTRKTRKTGTGCIDDSAKWPVIISVVGPRPLDTRGILLGWGQGWGGVGHVLTFMWAFTWRRCYAVASGWGMCLRSCELAHEVDATRTCSWSRCYAVASGWGMYLSRSCELAHEVDATRTCTWSRCYAVASGWGMYLSRSRELAHEVDATRPCTWSRCYAVAVGWDMCLSRSCELAHEVDATRTCSWSRCYAVASGWGMYLSRSCELAHEVDGNRAWKAAAHSPGIPVQSVVHQVKNFASEPQVVSRRLQHCRYPAVGPTLVVFERSLASSHGFEVHRAWAFHFAPIPATICVHAVLAINLAESRS